jgi:hypothetical protein
MEELENIRLRILTLISADKIILKSDSYLLEDVEEENEEAKRKRVKTGLKPHKYKKSDWKKAMSLKEGRHARIRLRLLLKRLEKAIKDAKELVQKQNKTVRAMKEKGEL